MAEKSSDHASQKWQNLITQAQALQSSEVQKSSRTTWESLSNIQWPTRAKQERYKYTNFRKLSELSFDLGAGLIDSPLAEQWLNFENRLVIDNGVFNTALSQVSSKVQFELKTLDFSTIPFSPEEAQAEPLLAFNKAFSQCNLKVSVADAIELAQPLLILHRQQGRGVSSHPCFAIDLGKDSNVAVLCANESLDDNIHWYNPVIELEVGDNSQAIFTLLQDKMPKSYVTTNLHANVHNKVKFQTVYLDIEQGFSRHEMNINVLGRDTHADLFGIYTPLNKEVSDHGINLRHEVEDATSDVIYKGVVGDEGRGVFHGGVYVAPDAQKVESQQSNQNVLISNKANIDTRPNLEIFADDVACGHGATIGSMDEDALFYLRSRGIEKSDAYNILLTSSLQSVIDRIENEILVEFLRPIVQNRIEILANKITI